MKLVVGRVSSLLSLLLLPATSIAGNNVWTQHGPAADVRSLAVHPSTPSIVYAGTTAQGAFASIDEGRSWSAVNRGLPILLINAVVTDPSDPDTAYAGTSFGLEAGVFSTRNRGQEWTSTGTSPGAMVGGIVVDPSDRSKLFAAVTLYECADPPSCSRTRIRGEVYRTTNAGVTWSATGLDRGYPVVAIVIDPTNPEILYAGTEGGAFKTTDGGANWSSAGGGMGCPQVKSLAIDPARPWILYAGSGHRAPNGRMQCGEVYKTTDGAVSWHPVGLTGTYVTAVLVDPAAPDVVYAGTPGAGFFSTAAGLFRSTDGGALWTRFEPLLRKTVFALASDPTGRQLYAGTSTGIYKYTFCENCREQVQPARSNPPTRTVPPRP